MTKLKIQSGIIRNDYSYKIQAMFTLKNGDFITNKVLGVGGENGLSSGVVSTPVAGSKLNNYWRG